MTVVIDASIATTTVNSYNLVSEVSAFAETMAPADFVIWDALDDDQKTVYIVRAARLLDTIPFPGTLTSLTQAMQWPRYGVEAPIATFDLAMYGAFYPVDSIPAPVKRAHAQLSVYLATQTTETFGTGDAGALSGLKVGPISLNFRADSASAPTTGRDYLQREIYPLLAAGNCVGSSRSVRLTR